MKTSAKNRARKKYIMHPQVIQIPAIINVSQNGRRTKVNFMIDVQLLKALNQNVPNGGKSDFVNEALEEALKYEARRKASDAMNEFRKTSSWKMTDEKIRNEISYGRP